MLALSLACCGCSAGVNSDDPASSRGRSALDVDGRYIIANATAARSWPSYGLDYVETRFSKLAQITAENVKELGWYGP